MRFDNKEEFRKYLEDFEKYYVEERPSSDFYLYNILVKRRKDNNLRILLKDEDFLKLCYTTLDSWGMNARKSKMISFSAFTKNVRSNETLLLELELRELKELDNGNEIEAKLNRLYEKTEITQARCKFVANSKLFHFLLPRLCPPMDVTYTCKFFGGSPYQNKTRGWKKYRNLLNEFKKYLEFTEYERKSQEDLFISYYPTKQIDNAIMWKIGQTDK